MDEAVYEGRRLIHLAAAARETMRWCVHVKSLVSFDLRKYAEPVVKGLALSGWRFFGGGYFIEFGHEMAFIVFGLILLFALLTLSDEIEASRRACELLKRSGYFVIQEQNSFKKILRASRFHSFGLVWAVWFDFAALFRKKK